MGSTAANHRDRLRAVTVLAASGPRGGPSWSWTHKPGLEVKETEGSSYRCRSAWGAAESSTPCELWLHSVV